MKKNRVKIVTYTNDDIYFTGSINIKTLTESTLNENIQFCEKYSWKLTKIFSGNQQRKDILSMVEKLDPITTEGVVVTTTNFERVWIRSSLFNSLYQLINLGLSSQVVIKFSDYQKYMLDIIRSQRKDIEQLWRIYNKLDDLFKFVNDKYEILIAKLTKEFIDLKDFPPEQVRVSFKKRDKTEKIIFPFTKGKTI